MRKKEFQNDTIETIYFGGTPSVLTSDEINFLIDSVYENYEVDENEITLEANPDDLSDQRILELSKVKLTALA
jgi:oxygen-independent coproporphyrinogen-3 oxidase